MKTDDRLQLLEEQNAHHAKSIEELSDQLTEQWKIIDALKSKFDRLSDRFFQLEATTTPENENTKPPHW